MKREFILLGVVTLFSLLAHKLFSGRKHIRSRKDDPSIPPVSTHAF